MMTLTWLKRIIWGATAVYWIGLFTLTHTPVSLPLIIVSSDKSAHFYGYAVLGGVLFAAMRIAGWRDVILKLLIIGLSYGAIDEWLQIPVGRSCELNDWFADAAGIALAAAIGGLIIRWRDRRSAASSW